MTKTNVLFVTLDQWRADHLAATGNPTIQTPTMDALCADGVTFRNHFTCIAPCGPSRTTFLTGMYPSNHRSIRNGTPLNHSLTNLAFEARTAGYDPTLWGYTDTTPDPRVLGEDHEAFLTYEGVMPGFSVGQQLPANSIPWLEYLAGKGYDIPGPGYAIYFPDPDYKLPPGRHPLFAPSRFKAEDSETHWLADQLIKDLKSKPSDPFFHHLTFLRPHPPFISPPEYHDLYKPSDMPLPVRDGSPDDMRAKHPSLALMYQAIPQDAFFMEGEGRAVDLDEEATQQIRATYQSLITEADHNLGRVIATLKEQGQYDETLIVVTSDHGEQLGDHYLWGKIGFYDESFHIPLIIKPPKCWNVTTGREISEFTESVDLMPTILDGLNLPIPRQCDGHSLMPFLNGETPAGWRRAVHWLYDFRDPVAQMPETALNIKSSECNLLVHRDAEFKYVHFAALPPLLFDVKNDPDETRNLAEDPDYQGVVLDCVQELLSWRMRYEYGELVNLSASDNGLVGNRMAR